MITPDNISWSDGLDAQQFLNNFWQKRPLLLKNAFPNFNSPISPDELAGLSIEEYITPRLILKDADDNYQLENGPFEEDRFSELDGNNWSLLVTDVEKYCPELSHYLRPFQFIPNWRIDDLMISYAPEGGSVGAHVDEYDVFLLQASGTRRWMIDSSASPDLTLIPDATLKLLANFNPNETHELQPGDMLYLPPGMPHHGIAASDNCTTWSIGFRAPTLTDVIHAYAELVGDKLAGERYRDPLINVSLPGEINEQTLQAFAEIWRQNVTLSDAELAHMTGRILTSPTIDVVRDEYDAQDISSHTWEKHSFSRFAYIQGNDEVTLYADTQAMTCSVGFATALCDNQSVKADQLDETDLLALKRLLECGCVVPVE